VIQVTTTNSNNKKQQKSYNTITTTTTTTTGKTQSSSSDQTTIKLRQWSLLAATAMPICRFASPVEKGSSKLAVLTPLC